MQVTYKGVEVKRGETTYSFIFNNVIHVFYGGEEEEIMNHIKDKINNLITGQDN